LTSEKTAASLSPSPALTLASISPPATVAPHSTSARWPPHCSTSAASLPTAPAPNAIRLGQSPNSTGIEGTAPDMVDLGAVRHDLDQIGDLLVAERFVQELELHALRHDGIETGDAVQLLGGLELEPVDARPHQTVRDAGRLGVEPDRGRIGKDPIQRF